jgi:hypothetical protein
MSMKSSRKQQKHGFGFVLVGMMALFLFFGSVPGLHGQVPDNIPGTKTAGRIRFSFEASPVYAPKTHVSGGGSMTFARYMAEMKVSMEATEKTSIGLGVSYEFDDYNFTPLTRFAVRDPWNKIHGLNVNGRMGYRLNQKWGLYAVPVIGYSGEEGADFGKSIMYGGSVGAAYTASPTFTIGIAAGVFYRLEQTVVFPAILVNWRVTDRFRVRNPYGMSPAGPAGIELGYDMGNEWNIALGGGYRSSRFRLSQGGPVPGGVGQTSAIIGYLNLTRRLGKHFNASIYGGAAFAGSIRIEDRTGERIDSTSYSTAPIMGLILTASF